MGKAYSTHVKERNAYRTSMGKPKGYKPLGTPRNEYRNNIVTCMSDYIRGLDWRLHLLSILTHDS
jgi:hypothetical protein